MVDPGLGPTAAQRLHGVVLRGEELTYYAEAGEERLAYCECRSCASVLFPPRVVCPECGGTDVTLKTSGGRGTVVSETSIVMAPPGIFAEWAPYQVVMVEVEEGFTMMSNIVGDTKAMIGDRVHVAYLVQSEGPGVPVFKVLEGPQPVGGREDD